MSEPSLPTAASSEDIPVVDAVVTPQEIKESTETEALDTSSNKEEKCSFKQLILPIMKSITFNNDTDDVDSIRTMNNEMKRLLKGLVELLRDKNQACRYVEKKNEALTVQVDALKDVVSITKDLLNIRNMEVEHLQEDMNKMEEKINSERQRHNTMLERMSAAAKLNQNLKNEYQTQLGLFQDLRGKYDEKVTLLTNENKRLQELSNESADVGEEDVTLSLETLPPR